MTDKELLELAAKAAELNYVQVEDIWNPLTDDGDALRLAVKLRMVIDPYAGLVGIPGLKLIPTINEGDPYAATRRAIVRAAAEIGKTL